MTTIAPCGAIFESDAAVSGHAGGCEFCKAWNAGFAAASAYPYISAICELDGCCMLRDKPLPQGEK